MFRLSDFAAGHSRRILAFAAAFAVVAAIFGGPVAGLLKSQRDFSDPASQSAKADERLTAASGIEPGVGLVALVRAGGDVRTSSAARAKVRRAQSEIARAPGIAGVISFYETGNRELVSRDGRSTYLPALFKDDRPSDDQLDALQQRLERLGGVRLGGPAVARKEVRTQVEHDLRRAELIAFPVLFLLSLLFFRSLVAAALPLFVGGISIVGTFLAMRLVNEGIGLSIFAVNLVTGVGLGLAIDYSLFMVSRYREELERHGHTREALRATMATAGRTVLFSAITVSAAMASLMVFPLRFLYSMGIGGCIVTIIGATTALVALPALLHLLGPRVNSLAPASWRRAASTTARGEQHGFWYRLSRGVMRRPGPVAAAATVLLVLIGLPFTGIRFNGVDAQVLPKHASGRIVDDALRAEFPPNRTSPVYIAVAAPRSSGSAVARWSQQLRGLPGVAAAGRPRPAGDHLWEVDVTSAAPPLAAGSKDLVRALRDRPAPFETLVGGQTAEFVDQQAALGASLPLALGLLALATFVALFAMTGSVVLPIKALVMNVLTLSGAFGLLVLIFQDGRLEGLLHYTSSGALDATQPVLLFAIAFGLSTDYGVFLLGRIKEARDAGLDDREAVAVGLERTGRIVSAAAVLFCVAIGAFATSEIVFIKEVGVGTALAVLIDATLVRALLVPSLMALLGRRNWWAPARLRRIHERWGWSEGEPRHVEGAGA